LAESHERLPRNDDAKPGSNRSFGITFAVVFLIIAFLPLVLHGESIILWAVIVSAAFLVGALMFPTALAPLNHVWFKFGLLLHHVISPVVLGILFFVVVTPFALVVRLFAGKLMALEKDEAAQSYWRRREPPGPAPETVRNQF